MSGLLIIHLNHDESACNWAIYQKGTPIDSGSLETESLHQLTEKYPNISTHLYVPSEKITILNALLPNLSRAALDSIPYQVEEQLCQPIEDYHLAYEKTKDKQIQVLACTKKQMSRWQDLISKSQLNIKLLSADCYLLPSSEAGAIWIDTKRTIIHSKQFAGAVSNSFAPILWEKIKVNDCQIFVPSSVKLDLLIPENKTDITESLITAFYNQRKQGINLLQTSETEGWPYIWHQLLKAPFFATLALIGLWITSMMIENHQLGNEITRLDREMYDLYQDVYPEAKRIINPAGQMRANLKDMVDKPKQVSFLESLSTVAPFFKENGITIKLIRFDQNTGRLHLSISAQSFSPIESLRSAIKHQNIPSEFNDLVQTPEGVTGSVTLDNSRKSL